MCNITFRGTKIPDSKIASVPKKSTPLSNVLPNELKGAVSLKTSDSYKPQTKQSSVENKVHNFSTTLEFSEPETLKSKINFRADISEAQKWKPGEEGLTGVQSNKIINTTYDNVDRIFGEYLNTKEPVANWMTFGKYASNESGMQIKTIEGTIEALKTLSNFNSSKKDNIKAVMAFSGVLSNPATRTQGIIMGVQIARNMSSNSLIQNMLINNIKRMSESGADTMAAGVLGAGLLALPGINNAIGKAINEMGTLHSGLVEGNTMIYKNIVPAFEIFLDAEKSGKDGVKALKDNGYGKPSAPNDKKTFVDDTAKDPQGFLLEGFTAYKQAKTAFDKGDKIKGQELMHKGNLLIGAQEQLCILQKDTIFGGGISKMVDAMSGTMYITDGQGKKNPLLNTKLTDDGKIPVEERLKAIKNILDSKGTQQKGWSDFEVRMGLKEVTKGTQGAIEIRMPPKSGTSVGEAKFFVQRDLKDPLAQGTITKYFSDGLSGANAKRNIADKPREMTQLYTSTDMKIGDKNYQLDEKVSGPFRTAEEALNSAKDIHNKQQKSYFTEVEDLAVSKVYENNSYKFYVKKIDSLNEKSKDISGVGELAILKFIGQSADNVYAIVAEDGSTKKNPLYKNN